MTYGIEWNRKPSKSEEVSKKDIDSAEDDEVELLDLPSEIIVIILNNLGYDELRSLECCCSYFR